LENLVLEFIVFPILYKVSSVFNALNT
jgi:hypothetical protein